MEKEIVCQPGDLFKRFVSSITTGLPMVLFLLISSGARLPHKYFISLWVSGLPKILSQVLAYSFYYGLPLLLVTIYGTRTRATLGMRLGDIDGEEISWRRSFVRIAVGIILVPLFPVSWFLAVRDDKRRTLADRICKTVVWNVEPVQSVEPHQPADCLRKFEATLNSVVIIFLVLLISWEFLLLHIQDAWEPRGGFEPFLKYCWLICCNFIVPFLWVVLDGARAGATIGMRKRKIRFGDLDGGQLSWGKCANRIAVGIACLPLFPISWVMALRDEKHRTLPDRICGTAVWIDSDLPCKCSKD